MTSHQNVEKYVIVSIFELSLDFTLFAFLVEFWVRKK